MDYGDFSLPRSAKPDWKPNTIRWVIANCGHWIRSDRLNVPCPRCFSNELDAPYIDEALDLAS